MTVSVLLRLLPAALSARRLSGEVVVVATGERRLVGNADELLDFLEAQVSTSAPSMPRAGVPEGEAGLRNVAGGNGDWDD
jgi:hypothetical protein